MSAVDARLRVLYVSPPLQSSGGIGRVAGYALAELRHDPAVEVTYRDSRGSGSVPRSFLRAVGVALHVVRKRRRYDLVHLNTSTRASTLRKGLVARAARLAGLPYVVHLHGSGYDVFYEKLPASLQRAVRAYFLDAAGVIVLGDHWRQFATGTLGVPADRLAVVPNTAPGPRRWTPRAGDEELRIAFLGRLDERKGAALALEALATLRREGTDLPAVVAGDGDDATLRALADAAGLRVELPGWVDATRVQEILSDSDVLLLPSAAENQPISVIEAMARGVIPVVTPVGAVTDLVEDGVSGLVLPERSSRAVADSLRRLTDQSLRTRLAAQARQRWEQSLTPERHVRHLVQAWRAAVETGGQP